MSFILTSVQPLTQLATTSFSPNWREVDLMVDLMMGKKVVGQLHSVVINDSKS